MDECFFHTGRPAVIRCKQCGRPLCPNCRHIDPHGIFCGADCAERFEVFAMRAEENEEKGRRGIPRPLLGFLKFVGIVVFLIFLYVIVRHLSAGFGNFSWHRP